MIPQLLSPDDPRAPKYWRYETSGVLVPVVEKYLNGRPLSDAEIGVMRAYLRQWVMSPVWAVGFDRELGDLRDRVEKLRTEKEIKRWLWDALDIGMDPL